MRLGFIGLGNMGLPMAINLLKANFEVYGKNRSKGSEYILLEEGGKTDLTIAQMASEVDIIMTCLPLPKDVEEVYLGEDGIVKNGHSGLIALDFSTVSPDLNEKIYETAGEKGIDFLDSPVSGGTVGAKAGTLSIMVGGNKDIYEKVKPILHVVGENVYYTGKVGSGTAIKLINQYMVGVHTQAVSEALLLAEKLEIDSKQLFDILDASFAQSRIFQRHFKQFIEKEQFEAGFALKLLHKDLNLVEKMTGDNNITLPIGEQVTEWFRKAKETDHANSDMSAMYLYMKEQLLTNQD
ncbi:NAD(P)-dependent oxidoreductase [Alkalihalobacillus sp. MEB130]|uniref:NAD(P)-dependent oxidoreductase n=1 Tax=Alkalihalobacillus sp. MEB130 TaxID=2976704 RepID=UPI0028DD8DD7|nr:NAD(P)-dependent oxidoreductase [Alkalihalobacillus sp. MEB130]MDT8862147.1 NAD(P)-dependent oxidoreductase [Alkalihalobacillus sp. MEB130]